MDHEREDKKHTSDSIKKKKEEKKGNPMEGLSCRKLRWPLQCVCERTVRFHSEGLHGLFQV